MTHDENSERGQPCPRVSVLGDGLADKAGRAPLVAALRLGAFALIAGWGLDSVFMALILVEGRKLGVPF